MCTTHVTPEEPERPGKLVGAGRGDQQVARVAAELLEGALGQLAEVRLVVMARRAVAAEAGQEAAEEGVAEVGQEVGRPPGLGVQPRCVGHSGFCGSEWISV